MARTKVERDCGKDRCGWCIVYCHCEGTELECPDCPCDKCEYSKCELIEEVDDGETVS